MERRENPGLVAAEIIGGDQVERSPDFGLVVVMPARAVPGAAFGNLLCAQTKQEEVVLTRFLAISIVAPSRVPMVNAPFIMNFMLLVPLAS